MDARTWPGSRGPSGARIGRPPAYVLSDPGRRRRTRWPSAGG